MTANISIHALREEGDLRASGMSPMWKKFLSTPSARRATRRCAAACGDAVNFYPRPPRGGRRPPQTSAAADRVISIHALREEGDKRGGMAAAQRLLFLSTPSARRATKTPRLWYTRGDISIHALREEGDHGPNRAHAPFQKISIHALREEGDAASAAPFGGLMISIHALREEGDLHEADMCAAHIDISIHALREEGDVLRAGDFQGGANFYPRPPRGGRPSEYLGDVLAELFLSTPSARRATLPPLTAEALRSKFLSTPSARRATCRRSPSGRFCGYFYPRPPRGGRPLSAISESSTSLFLSTPSARRATLPSTTPC